MSESIDLALREAFAPSADRAGESVLAALHARGAPSLAPPLLRAADAGRREPLHVFTSTSERREAAKLLGGRYEMLGELDRGGSTIVLQARDRDLGREVALKVLDAHALSDPALVDAFVLEARLRGRLEHPGCVPPYEIGLTDDGRPYLALRLPRGESLESLLAKRRDTGSELRRFLEIFEDAAQALAHAHERGVAHRGLDARRILVGPFGEVQLIGWDRADAGGDAAARAADVEALGELLCAILTGNEVAGQRDLALERLSRVVEPRELAELAERCLAQDASARPREASELAAGVGDWLRRSLSRERERELAAARAEQSAIDARRQRRWTVAVVLALLALGAGTVGFAAWRQSERDARRAQARERLGAGLARAEVALGRALEAAVDARTAAVLAVESAVQVETDASAENVDAELRARIARLVRRARAQQRATEESQAVRERRARLLGELEALRDRMALDWDLVALDRAFARVLATHGLELEAGSLDAAIAAARAHEDVEIIVPALDSWAAHRLHRGIEGADRLLDLALALDADAKRSAVRRAVRLRDVAALRAAVADLRSSAPSEQLHRLVFAALLRAGERAQAEEEARRAIAARPEEFWARLDLVGSWLQPTGEMRGEIDANELGPALAALALRPSSLATTHLAGLLLARAQRAPVALALVEGSRNRWSGLPADLQPLLRMNLSSVRRDSGDLAGALEAQREARAVAPDDGRVLSNEGLLLGALGRFDEAEAVLRALLEREPSNFHALTNLGTLLTWHRKRPAEAEPYFRRAVECRADDATAWSHLGTCLYEQREKSKDREARACHEKALALDPRCLPSLKMLGHLHLIDARGAARAADLYRRALELAPGSAEIQHLLGVALDRLGRKSEALHYLAAATRSENATGRMFYDFSRALAVIGRSEEARAAAERAVVREESVPHLVHLGSLLSDHFAEHDRALEVFDRAYELGAATPDGPHLLAGLCRSICLRAKGQAEEACAEVIELSDHPAHHPGSLRACAGFLRDGGRSADAVSFAARAAELAPQDLFLRLQWAFTLEEAELRGDAVEVLRGIEADFARSAEAQREVGAALRARLGDPEAAAIVLRRAAQRWPSDAKLRFELALALRDGGASEEALRELAAVERTAPSATARSEEAALQLALGRPARALRVARAALELDPASTQAHKLFAASAHELGLDLEALGVAEDARRGAPEDPELRALQVELLVTCGRYREATLQLESAVSPHELALRERCRRLRTISERWPASIGEAASPSELLDEALVALARRSFVRSARTFARILEKDPMRFEAEPGLRVAAAEAALAGARGLGADGGFESAAEADAHCALALRWLRDDLTALGSGAADLSARRAGRSRLERWLQRVGPHVVVGSALELELERARELRETLVRSLEDDPELPR